jgi:hypothetical protein
VIQGLVSPEILDFEIGPRIAGTLNLLNLERKNRLRKVGAGSLTHGSIEWD